MTGAIPLNRKGTPITDLHWGKLFDDPDYKRIGYDDVDGCEISTVWIGKPHVGWDPREIFETLIFGKDTEGGDTWSRRYKTEFRAVAGHAAAVAWVRGDGPESK